MENEIIIAETKAWVKEVVIGLNFCPFALKEFNRNSIRYVVVDATTQKPCLERVLEECKLLDEDESIETTLIIFPNAFKNFNSFLSIVDKAEGQLFENDYEGIYQVANFHPDYLFAGSDDTDAANYTNRSIYPMLHLLREASLDKVLSEYADPDKIPDRNIELARKKGLQFMQQLRQSCRQR
ncbi:MAG: hypothetical protein RJA07_1058 [Bacteroidota bacterium]|jgi:hypothetical protein